MSWNNEGRALVSFAVFKDGEAKPGAGEVLDVVSMPDGAIDFAVRRPSRREDGRGGRSMGIHLSRHEALALGRHLIGEASGLGLVKNGADTDDEVAVHLNLWNQGPEGRFMVSLNASSVGDEVLLSMDRLLDGHGGLRWGGEVRALLDAKDARSFARALLAMTRE